MKYITIEHETDTAHRLTFHKGKCKNLHGHRYKFVVSIEVSDANFVDFYDLKSIVKTKLDEFFDHATILKKNAANEALGELLVREGNKVRFMSEEPTVEHMVDFVWNLLRHHSAIMLDLCQLTIYETPTNYCTRRAK